MATNTHVALATVTADGSLTSYTFSNIPQTYTDLVLIIEGKNSQSGGNMSIRFNGDTGSNYSRTYFYGDGTSVASGRASNATALDGGGTSPSGSFVRWEIFNYASTSMQKTVLEHHVEPARLVARQVGLWRSTAAITSIQVTTQAALNSGQTISLYGVKAQIATGTAKATGGTITYDNYGNVIHTFTGNGSFVPSQALTVDYLVVAGGASGGSYASGGGGAGGLRSTVTATGGGAAIESPLLLTSNTSYTVTIGAGGTAVNNSGVYGKVGIAGGDSTFATITSAGGGGGGGYPSLTATSGGSGGGGWAGQYGGITSVGANGTARQGYSGGSSNGYAGAGGGGAGAVGSSVVSGSSVGGAGGNGIATPISGSWITYAGGGGGAGASGGAGGLGGGGAAANGSSTPGGSGTANTGGGGGGVRDVGDTGTKTSGAGGSGIVIIRYSGV